MKLYLAGPMRGYPDHNETAFIAAAAQLRGLGHEVFSPVEHTRAVYGDDILKGSQGSEEVLKKQGFRLRAAMAADLEWICTAADGLALLPGWKASKGAMAEYHTAVALGLVVLEQHAFGWRRLTKRARKKKTGLALEAA